MKKFIKFCLMMEKYPCAVAVFTKELSEDDYWELLKAQSSKSSVTLSFRELVYRGKVDSAYMDIDSDYLSFYVLSEYITESDISIRTVMTKIIKSGWKRTDHYMYYEELPIERVMEKVGQMIEKRKK